MMNKYFTVTFMLLFAQGIAAQECNNSIPASTPQDQFTINGEEATDKKTGLTWRRCSHGQTGGDRCIDKANVYYWQDALLVAEAERNKTGKAWRLPNANELRSIVEERCYDPAINVAVFPEFLNKQNLEYWTNSAGTYSVSYVEFKRGERRRSSKDYGERYIRLVRDK